MQEREEQPGCAAESLGAAEPIAGTGPNGINAWLVLEDNGRWPAKALPALDASDAVLRVVMGAKKHPQANLVLARGPCDGGQRRLWFAWVGDGEETLLEVTLPNLDALADFPVDRVCRGDVHALFDAYPGRVRTIREPLVLVCTHGQRDRCCARLGAPVASALGGTGRGLVLRTTHLGGHRFAPTALVLPLGLMYGRMTADDPGGFFNAIERREIVALDQYRGRSCWPRPVQAALHQWRLERGELRLDWVHVLGRIQGADGSWRVALTSDGAGPAFCEYVVRQVPLGRTARKSCRDEQPSALTTWQAVRVDG